jgi:RNA polymerase sigma-70 factor (ECF subfamily)
MTAPRRDHTEYAASLAPITENRDGLAFENLYSNHAGAAFVLATSLTGDRALAEDAVQESMLRVWRSAGSFHPGNVRGWILRIVGRECIRLMKRRRQERVREKYVLPREPIESKAANAEKDDTLSALQTSIAGLAEPDRRLMALHYVNGLSQRKISKTLAVPQQTISNRIRQILHQLGKQIN